jgi:hypothetical protein
VLNSNEMKNEITKEMHNMPYARRPGYQKTIAVLRSQYFWPGMKKEVVDYIAKCLEYHKVNIEHRHLAGLL